MAKTNRSTNRVKDNPLIARLKALGCVFCPTCFAFVYPDHTRHIASLAADWTPSKYRVVGGYGNVSVVDVTADAA